MEDTAVLPSRTVRRGNDPTIPSNTAMTSLARLFASFLTGVLLLAASSNARGQQYGLESRPPFAAFNGGTLPTSAPTFSGTWSAVRAFQNITFLNPMGLVEMPVASGQPRKLVVWEREGRIYFFDKNPSVAAKTLMLDLSNQTQGWDDSGMMGIAFHPNFLTNRYLFVYYTYVPLGTVIGNPTTRPPTNTPNRDRLSRFTVNADGTVNAASETVFIDQISNSVWHNGGGMFFHPVDGFLYLTNGDDNNGGNNQRINTSLHSCVLRIDVDRRGGAISHPIPKQPTPAGSATANYYIPNDNPFVGQAGALEEIWALGLRSPHRMTIDPPSGRIFIGDVGQGSREEVTAIEPTDPAGLNLQWNRIEGLGDDLAPPYIGVNKRPIIDYPRSDGVAVIGGYVYRGAEFAADLAGRYIFGDNVNGTVWYLNEATTPATKVALCTLPEGPGPNSGSDYRGLSSFGVDADNEIYMCQLSSTGGGIYKFSRTGTPPQQPPLLLSQTGVFSSLTNLTPSSGFIGYDVNNALWSDGANKKRWFGVPTGTSIGYSPSGEWTFPQGSVFVKHFELPTDDTNPATHRRLETRLLVRDNQGFVYGASYKWRPDNSDADLVQTGTTENVSIAGELDMAELASTDIGGPLTGSTARLEDGYQVTGGGADIWGNSDSFRFAHEQRTGDFDVVTRVESLSQADLYTKAGLMARESLAANARHVYAMVFPSNAARNNNNGGYEFQFRETVAGASAAIYPAQPQPLVRYPNTWLRMKREGNTFTAYFGRDGLTWTLFATKVLALPQTLYFGIAVTSHNAGALATARFHFKIDRTQPWFFPGRQDCLSCHTSASGGVLGLNTPQSHRDSHFPQTNVTDGQIRAWNHAGYFAPAVDEGSLPGLQKLAPITDTTVPVEHRMRSYLDSNCSHCHRPGGVHAFWDARIETSLENAGIVNGIVADSLGISNARVIAPKNLARSVMYHRVSTATAQHKMPPLAKNVVDQGALALLEDWIAELDTTLSGVLPPPWQNVDVGDVGVAGSAAYAAGMFSAQGSGADIWNNADAFHFVHQPLYGDGEITARVLTLDPTDGWAKAGVMIRENLDAGSKHAMTVVSPGNGAAFQRRVDTDGISTHTAGPNVLAPYWVRLQRAGDVLTSSVSANGTTWTVVGTETISMLPTVSIGLCVTSHNNAVQCTAMLDNVTLSTGAAPAYSVNIDFQPAAAPTFPGYLVDGGAPFAARGNGYSYGWNADNAAQMRDRNNAASPDQRFDTLVHIQEYGTYTWELAVPNGRYHVHAVCGDPSNINGYHHHLLLEGSTILDAIPTNAERWIQGSMVVDVNDGRLTMGPGPNGVGTKVCFIEVKSVAYGTTCVLTAPSGGATYAAPAAFTLSANATTTGGDVTNVEFLNGTTVVGSVQAAPYNLLLQDVPPGNYNFMARVTNNTGGSTTSASASVTVTGTPWTSWWMGAFTQEERTQPALTGPLADFDRDGLSNLIEYVFSGDAKVPSTLPLAITSRTEDALFVTFQVNASATDAQLAIQYRTSLATGVWTSDGVTYEDLGTVDGIRTRRARVPLTAPGSECFVRASVTLP
jgi:glucose/arabinose dehydrogenase/regulation of enolase protein 1 (concanavalin A-like superfamily)